MIKIGKMELGGRPKIAISVDDTAKINILKKLFVDILEIRVDQFKKFDPGYVRDIIMNIKKSGAPLIMTIRSKAEGGQRNVPDKLKLEIFRSAIPLVDAIDIELKSSILSEVIKLAKRYKKLIIVSSHNFRSTPDDRRLKNILTDAKGSGARIVKIAVKANSIDDVNRLMKFTIKNRDKNLITISLGPVGSISRLIFPMAGSLVTYAYVTKPSGPGQMPLKELRQRLSIYYLKK